MIRVISDLIDLWKRRAADALPADAMLINKCIRELEEASEADRLEAALRTIMDAHKFNVAALRANEVHEICYRALGLDPYHEAVKAGPLQAVGIEDRVRVIRDCDSAGKTQRRILKGTVGTVVRLDSGAALVHFGDYQTWVRADVLEYLPHRPIDQHPKREPIRSAAPLLTKPKLVVSGGMTWKIWSRNERETTLGGRYFFACRCKPNTQWVIIEHDNPLGGPAPVKEIRRSPTRVASTKFLSAEVQLFHAARERNA